MSNNYRKMIKRGYPNLKRGQKNKKIKFYSNKTGTIYVPKDLRAELSEMSLKVFGSKNKYKKFAWLYNITLEEITQQMKTRLEVK